LTDDISYQVIRLIEQNPEISQRELSHELGVSLGKANYCLKALIDKGWIKARNFKNSQNKLAYRYLLTPDGIEQKARVTVQFLRRKLDEYERLRREIESLRNEVAMLAEAGKSS
jgi:EPS-associated MarR family transcriptional regulator